MSEAEKWAVIAGLLDHMMTLPLTGPWRPDTWTVLGLMLEVMRDDLNAYVAEWLDPDIACPPTGEYCQNCGTHWGCDADE